MRNVLEGGLLDLRQGWRSLLRAPGPTGAAAFILALAIGAATTVFTLVDAVLLRPLPVPSPERLVYLRAPSFSYPIFRELRTRLTGFDGIFAWDTRSLYVRLGREVVRTTVVVASGEMHEVLRLQPLHGRLLTAADEGTGPADARPVAVISHRAWQRWFGGDPGAIGRTLHVEQLALTIVGVTPPTFLGVAVGTAPDVTIPVTLLPLVRPEEAATLTQPARAWLHIMGRLAPGATLATANAELAVHWRPTLRATVDGRLPLEVREHYLTRDASFAPGARGFSGTRNRVRQPLFLLFGLVSLVLVAACAAVGNIALARTAARRRDLGIRMAIGAGRTRLARQLGAEAALLVAGSAAGGLLFSVWAADAVVLLLSTRDSPVVLGLRVDWRILAFVAGVTSLATLIILLAPMLVSLRLDPSTALRSERDTPDAGPRVTSRVLVALQMALAVALVGGAALFVRSMIHLLTIEPGFDRERLVVISPDVLAAVGGPAAGDSAAYYGRLASRLRAVPGVDAVALSWVPPVSHEEGAWTQSVGVDGAPPARGASRVFFNAVSPGFFRTVGTPRVAGRDFTDRDRAGAPPVVIVNRTLATLLFGSRSPLGHRLTIGHAESRRDLEVVGLVANAKYQHMQEPPRPIAYLPWLQAADLLEGSNFVLSVRTPRPQTVEETLRQVAAALDPSVPVRAETMAARVDDSLTNERLLALLASFLGLVSALLAAGAVYGTTADFVARRTREIGIRLALGADRRRVLWMTLRQALTTGIPGCLAGLAVALAAGRSLSAALHGVTATDPLALAVASGGLVGIALLAAYLPARRAAGTDPSIALRTE